jgi:hypothetical protein
VNPNTARLLFDECLGRPSIERLSALVATGKGEKPEIKHILEFAPSGTRDEVWIPRLASEGWTVITTDGGRTPNKLRGEKLPQLCTRHSITHVIISPYVHNRTSFEKLLTILSVWYELLDLAADPTKRGLRYSLEPVTKMTRGQGRLIARPVAPRPQTKPSDIITTEEGAGTEPP